MDIILDLFMQFSAFIIICAIILFPITVIAMVLYLIVGIPILGLINFLTMDIEKYEPVHSCVDGDCHRQQQKNEYIYNYDDDNYKY